MSDDDTPRSRLIAAEIRKLLFLRNLNATQLAERAGMTQPYISRRLTGATVFDVEDLYGIAEALDVEVAALLPTPAKTRGVDINSSYAPPVRTVNAGGRTDEAGELVTAGAGATRSAPCHASGRSPRTATATSSAPRARQAWRTA